MGSYNESTISVVAIGRTLCAKHKVHLRHEIVCEKEYGKDKEGFWFYVHPCQQCMDEADLAGQTRATEFYKGNPEMMSKVIVYKKHLNSVIDEVVGRGHLNYSSIVYDVLRSLGLEPKDD